MLVRKQGSIVCFIVSVAPIDEQASVVLKIMVYDETSVMPQILLIYLDLSNSVILALWNRFTSGFLNPFSYAFCRSAPIEYKLSFDITEKLEWSAWLILSSFLPTSVENV